MPLVNPSEASGLTLKSAEVDFGAAACQAGVFVITDAAITPSTKIIASHSGEAATGKSADENEFESFDLRTVSGTGQFTVFMQSLSGYVRGTFKIVYMS